MKLLVTGIEGYIGCLLGPFLQERGHDVLGLDTGYHREGWLFSDRALVPSFPRTLNRDVRRVSIDDVRGFDAVVHLAELPNDPLLDSNPELTFEINHQASVRLAQLAKAAGVKRFVYTSCCSVYGSGNPDRLLDERSPIDPQTTYATCKALVERDIAGMVCSDFSPTFLRKATPYGASPRMRFDTLLNQMVGRAATTGMVTTPGDGSVWRPFVHVLDLCESIACVLEAPRDAAHGEIFNVGSNSDNYQLRNLARVVADAYPGCELAVDDDARDKRSYRVSFAKIRERLPAFRCYWDVRSGVRQMHDLFRRIRLDGPTVQARQFSRLKQLHYLNESRQVDEEFYWMY